MTFGWVRRQRDSRKAARGTNDFDYIGDHVRACN
jgi:hypothetical protein